MEKQKPHLEVELMIDGQWQNLPMAFAPRNELKTVHDAERWVVANIKRYGCTDRFRVVEKPSNVMWREFRLSCSRIFVSNGHNTWAVNLEDPEDFR